jgi:hypothetical protein
VKVFNASQIKMSQIDTLIKTVTNKFIDMVVKEINNQEMRDTIHTKLVNPLLTMIYKEVYPYIFALLITIFLILLFSLLTFVLFVLSMLPKRSMQHIQGI